MMTWQTSLFDTELSPYLSCGEVFRNWSRNEPTPDTIIMSFSEAVKLPLWGFGGFKTNNGSVENAVASFTFYDGPNATGNKIVSSLAAPGGRAQINIGDPAILAINELQGGGMGQQETELYDGTYYYEGQDNSRGWTILNMGDAVFQSIMVIQYAVETGASPEDYVILNSPNAINSGYWASFDLVKCGCASEAIDYNDYSLNSKPCGDEPCHIIDSNLYLGQSVSPDASSTPNEMADSDDDDGVSLNSKTQFVSGNTVRIPVTIYNNTGNAAFLRMWIDWNADGDFEDANEQIENNSYPSTGTENTVFVSVTVPSNAIQTSSIALRARLSTDDVNSATPCGTGTCASDGEIEDYLIQLTCPTKLCTPVQLIKKNTIP